ncbi:uncharacterized protein AKAME5_001618100 [Lates japonicus]|uniref:Uncharacterized protein n=1 Tax=Lates japonicus TaxID=270547 RepID=A0AAD3N253_LATJO|nr:uncharacterized protein AKAME5_001618100 [Lates japonicus]
MESADPSASACEAPAETVDDQLKLFVTVLTMRVLTKCRTLKVRRNEEWVAHTKHLVEQTLEELTVSEGFRPDLKDTKKVCKAVVSDLKERFGRKSRLESVMLLQHPKVDSAIIQSLQTHIKEHSTELANKTASTPLVWKEVLQLISFTAGILAAVALMIVIV